MWGRPHRRGSDGGEGPGCEHRPGDALWRFRGCNRGQKGSGGVSLRRRIHALTPESGQRLTAGGDRFGKLATRQRAALLGIARRSIESCLGAKTSNHQTVDDPDLARPGAAFVTLTLKDKLRGCIGYSEPMYPLHEAVSRCAVAAATQDLRFSPITEDELPELEISVSALSPLQKLEDIEKLEPGRHGLMVIDKEHRGLLLPQVAAERGWDRKTFLAETCRKAGLSPDAWKNENVEIFVFEAEVFSEKDLGFRNAL